MMVNELTLCLFLVVAFPVWFVACHGSNCGNFSSETYAHQLCQIFWNVSNLPDYWLSSSDVCSWTANADEIHCQTGILTKLDLSSKNLQGSLSLEYQWPSDLLFINIKNNSLLGTWNSSNYQNLPTTIVHLDISQNEFDGVIDLSSLAEHDQLLRLIMSKNSFSELSFNNSNGILTNLSSFVASNNIISNSIPNLSNLNGLSILDLSNNQINGNLLWEYIPSNIKQIELSHNEISSNLFENLTDIPQYVGFINFENNDLFGSINLDNLPESVDYLNLYNNSLTGPIDFSSISANISIKIDVSVYCDFEIYCTTVIDDCNLTFIDTMVDRSQSFCSGLIDCENTCQCDSCIFEPSVIPTEMPSQEPTFSGPVTTEMVNNNDNSTETDNNNSSMTTTSDVTVEPPGGDGNGSENDASLIDSLLDPSTPTFYYFIGAIVALVLCCICFIMIYYTKRSTKEFEKDKTLVSIKSQTKLNVDQATDSQKKDENSRSSMDKANQNGFIQVDSMSPTNPKGNGSYENVPNSPTSPQTQSQNSNTSSAMNQQQHIKRVDSDQDSNLEPHINRKVTVNYSHNSFADIDKENENDNDNDSDSSSSNAIAAATAAQIISQRNVFAGVQMAKIQSNPNSMTISAKGVMNNYNNNNNNNNNNGNENEDSESSSSSSAKAQAAVEAHMAVERYRSIDMGIQHQQSQQENSLHSNRNSEHNGMNNNEFGMLGEEPGAIRPGSARVRSSTQVAQQQNKAANDVQLVGEIGGESDSGNDEMDQLPNLQQPPMRDNSMLNNYMNVEHNMNNNNNNNRMSVNSNNWDNRSIHSDINPLNNLQNPYMGHHSSIASLPPKPISAQLHFNNSNHNHSINNNNNNGGSNGMNKLRHRSNRSNSFDNVGDLLAVLQASEDDGGYNKKDDDVQSVQLPMQPSVYRNARHNTEVTDIVRYNEMKQKQQQQRQHEQNDIIMNYLKQNQNVNVDKLQASPISSSQQQAFANFGKNNNINNNNMNNNMNNNNSNNNNNMNNINPLDNFSLLQHGGGGGNGSGYNSHRNSQASQISTSQQHALLSLNNSIHNHNHNNQNRISKLSVASQSSYQGSGANVASRHSSINLSVIDGDNENKMNVNVNVHVNGNDIKMDDDDDGDMEDLYSDDIPELGQLDMRQVKKNEQNDNEMDNNQHKTMGAPGTPNAPRNASGNGETPVGNKPPMDFNQAGEGEYADYAD